MPTATEASRDLVRKLRAALARRRDIAQIIRELEATSDRLLAEMGIARGDIRALAHGADRA